MHPQRENLAGLPIAERIQLVKELWDIIASSSEEFPIQEWQRELVQLRLADFESGEEQGLTLEQVWDEVDKRRAQ